MMNPEPTPSALGAPGAPFQGIGRKRRKSSGTSVPGGRRHACDWAAGRMARVTSTLTTAGRTALTRSAKPPCIAAMGTPATAFAPVPAEAPAAAFAGLQGSPTATAPMIAADTATATRERRVRVFGPAQRSCSFEVRLDEVPAWDGGRVFVRNGDRVVVRAE